MSVSGKATKLVADLESDKTEGYAQDRLALRLSELAAILAEVAVKVDGDGAKAHASAKAGRTKATASVKAAKR